MRVIYGKYAATTYGSSCLSITDPDGREVFHTNERSEELDNERMLSAYLKDFVKEKRRKKDAVKC